MKKRVGRRKKIKTRDWIILAISAGFVLTGLAVLWAGSLKTPDFGSFEERKVAQSTKIYDRTGEVLLYDIHQDIKRTVVPFEDMSVYLKNATVAIEDAEFYQHNGVRPLATLRGLFLQPLRGKGVQGGSTITQQVIKNSLLTSERKISRKLKEWVLAIKIEQVMSKEEILAIYLNEAPYGGSIYGAQEASRAFFGRDVGDISLAEAAYLAALPQAPTYYSPYGNNVEALRERKNLVLSRMHELGFISDAEYAGAKSEEVTFIPREAGGIKAPHFVFYIQSYLEEKYGKDAVEAGGLKVVTTLDYSLQKKAEEIVHTYAMENAEKFNASNAGLIAVDPKTGQILVMVGSRDYFDENIDGNFNITIAHRQPGSAFKPFVYATAFKKGYTPDTVVFDLPTQFQTTCDAYGNPVSPGTKKDECYMPVNYDGKYHGPMSLREALAQSVNIPAIKTLYLAGLQDSLQTAKDFGLSSLTNIAQYGLTLVLGGGEVSLLDITNAYGVFANDGVKNSHVGILSIEDSQGNKLESYSPRPEKIISENIAHQISDVLSDNEARAPAFGSRSFLYFEGRDVAVKTGTTNDYRDAWIIGYTPSISVGAWAGNNDNSAMEKKVAGFIIAPLWNAFMREALGTMPIESFKKPLPVAGDTKPIVRGLWKGGEIYYIDTVSGKRATEHTPEETKEERILTNVHSILYWVDKKDPLGATPPDPKQDPQFRLWEPPVLTWAIQNGFYTQGPDSIPSSYDDVHTPSTAPNIQITNPSSATIYGANDRIISSIQYSSSYPITKVDFFLNGTFIGSSLRAPFTFSFTPSQTTGVVGTNTLRVVGYDSVFNKNDSSTTFVVR